MIIAGLTGSIGMGKSTTAQMFIDAGVPVFDADACVHELYENEAIPLMADKFPQAIANGRVDRDKLSALVINDPPQMKLLEEIIHPLVQEKRKQFLELYKREGAKLVILDIPLLFEIGADKSVDKIIVVTASADIQRTRVLAREGMSKEKFEAILARQTPDKIKRERADFIVESDFGLDHAQSAGERNNRAIDTKAVNPSVTRQDLLQLWE